MKKRGVQLDIFTGETAAEARDAGVNAAAANAGQAWQVLAWSALMEYIKRDKLGHFTCEDVREVMGVPEPPDRRAWGAIMLRAARQGLIQRAGFVEHRDRARHCGISILWRVSSR